MDDNELKALVDLMRETNDRIVTAESLTCGMIASTLVTVPGASDVVNGGFSVYQDSMKAALLGVPQKLLDDFTAVSAQVAEAMAKGALEKTDVQVLGNQASTVSIAVTGYASSPGDPTLTGLVYIGIGTRFNNAAVPEVHVHEHCFSGSRTDVRQATTDQSLRYVAEILSKGQKS